MAVEQPQIRLTVPATRYDAPTVETQLTRVREWVEALPYANLDATVEQVYERVFALNRCRLKPHQRYALLELVALPIRRATEHQQDTLRRAPTTKLADLAEAAALARRIAVEMAYGYKLVIQDKLPVSTPGHDSDAVFIGAIHRAVRYLSDVLVHHYAAYLPFPTNVWKELHQLYAYAERHGFERRSVRTNDDPGPETISDAYKQILLTSLADAYSLTSIETWTVYGYLNHQARLATLTTLQPMPNPLGHFIVDLNSDAPPTPVPKIASPPSTGEHLRLLNGRELAASARDQLVSLRAGSGVLPAGFDETLGHHVVEHALTRMVAAWGLTRKRSFARYPRRGWVDMVIGLEPVHARFGGERTRQLDISLDELDVGDLVLERGESAAPASDDAAPALTRAEILNESAGGMGLSVLATPEVEPAVGQLIGIRAGEPAKESWAIGVVRRVFSLGPGELEVGVQYLTPDAQAVAVRASSTGVTEHGYTPALLYSNQQQGSSTQVLLTPRDSYVADARYSLYNGTSKVAAKAVRLVESTPFFDHFVVDIG